MKMLDLGFCDTAQVHASQANSSRTTLMSFHLVDTGTGFQVPHTDCAINTAAYCSVILIEAHASDEVLVACDGFQRVCALVPVILMRLSERAIHAAGREELVLRMRT